jgi:hypothetical protein
MPQDGANFSPGGLASVPVSVPLTSFVSIGWFIEAVCTSRCHNRPDLTEGISGDPGYLTLFSLGSTAGSG